VQQQLSDIIAEFEHAERRLTGLAESIPDDRWNVRRDPSAWSAAECVAHLNLTSEAYIPRIQKAIEEARKLPPHRGKYHRDFVGWLFAKLVGPLPKIGKRRIGKVKTTPSFVPTGDHPKQVTLAEFKRLQGEIMNLVKECDGLAIHKTKIVSPFGEKVSYNTFSTFHILSTHEERHLQQAEGVWE
jgi:hypothetical protein